jgi:hypothetical protein
VIDTFLKAERARVEIQCFVLIGHEHRHVHNSVEHLHSSIRIKSSADLTIQRARIVTWPEE